MLRRVMGQPCHLRLSRVRLRVLDQAGSQVVLSTSNRGGEGRGGGGFCPRIRAGHPRPYLAICDPRGTFTAVASVGPYVARRTVAGSEIDCRGS